MKKKLLYIGFLAILLSCSSNISSERPAYISRDSIIESNNLKLNTLLSYFDDSYSSYDYNSNSYLVEAKDKISLKDNNYLVNMSLEDNSENDIVDLDKSNLSYVFEYDCENYLMKVRVTKEQDGFIEEDKIEGIAFTNSRGEIDFRFYIANEFVYLSDFNNDLIVKTGWLSNLLTAIVVTIVVKIVRIFCPPIALLANAIYAGIELTEDVNAVINYNHNKNLSVSSSFSDGYVHGQGKMSEWKFGTSTLDEVGCGAIAVFNSLKILGDEKSLAAIIFDFDVKSGTLALGYFGADPSHVSEYLRARNRSVSTCYSIKSLKDKLDEESVAIVCQINDTSNIMDGGHYYVVIKSGSKYYTYNRYNNHTERAEYSKFEEIGGDYSKLIVGYIVK